MEELVKKIISRWEEQINSINISGFTRKVESVNYFRMNAYYTNQLGIEWCYKVTFNFPLEEGESISNPVSDIQRGVLHEKWNRELEDKFKKMFWDKSSEVEPTTGSREHTHLYTGEYKFHNNKVDYMDNQGYRFIIQFYPEGFLPIFRDEKLTDLGL